MTVKKIWIHCSATPWGDAVEFDRWHRERGWRMLGYHFVIQNGQAVQGGPYIPALDGSVSSGRPLGTTGAHVKDHNTDAAAICLVGLDRFSTDQLVAVKRLILWLLHRYGLAVDDVLGHCEAGNTDKTCPNIPMDSFRAYLRDHIGVETLRADIRRHNER